MGERASDNFIHPSLSFVLVCLSLQWGTRGCFSVPSAEEACRLVVVVLGLGFGFFSLSFGARLITFPPCFFFFSLFVCFCVCFTGFVFVSFFVSLFCLYHCVSLFSSFVPFTCMWFKTSLPVFEITYSVCKNIEVPCFCSCVFCQGIVLSLFLLGTKCGLSKLYPKSKRRH